jgi:hypothetical protein
MFGQFFGDNFLKTGKITKYRVELIAKDTSVLNSMNGDVWMTSRRAETF